MNRYSTSQYLIIALALVIGLVYTLPNFYGESPAVQVSPHKATLKADDALMAQVRAILAKGGVEPQEVFAETNSVKARLADEDTQIKAKDVLQRELGEDYVVALNLLS